MATYKVIQDIEAEDKILGPLTLRQFIFAIISIFLFYISFILLSKGAGFLLAIFIPPALFFGFFAMPFGRDQPTEIWALAKLRYYFKPRQRIWNQSGVKELVTITVPKRVEQVFTNGLSQTEVRSRLQALATTIDSRGWAVKNVDVNTYAPQSMAVGSSDRLLDLGSIPQLVPESDIVASDDILDETNNPVARQFDSMITQTSREHRQQLIDEFNSPEPVAPERQPDPWFMNNQQPAAPKQPAADLPMEGDDPAEEAALTAQLRAKTAAKTTPYGNMRTVQPAYPAAPSDSVASTTSVTAPADPAILSLANNDDLNVATLAREANKARGGDQDEVVIPLH